VKKDIGLIGLTVAVTLAFGWVLLPLFGGIFWAVAFAIVFDPLVRRLAQVLGGRRSMAALVGVAGFVLLILLPMIWILNAVVQEATGLVAAIQSGEIDLHGMFQSVVRSLPLSVQGLLVQLGFGDLAGVQSSVVATMTDWVGAGAPRMLSFGMGTAGVVVTMGVMLYLMFFLFRDGDLILDRLTLALPMDREVLTNLMATFTQVVRATVRGDILVALLQGCLGGLGFWVLGLHAVVLWTILMAFLSLFPLFGAALIWLPVSLYLMATGEIWQGIGLFLYGLVVISLIDNIARPWLVGQATRMPDYIVLTSTLGGIATFGMQGFITGPVIAALFMAVWTTSLGPTASRSQGQT
jgi:predicted PurR-regulated permease PerM